jgi:outer membrane protein W
MRRLLSSIAAALIIGFVSTPVASAQQTFNMFIGGFTPRSLDARDADDVILFDSGPLATFDRNAGISMNEFNNVTFGGEYLVGLGNNFEGGLGIGFYTKTVPTSYANFTDQSGNEIEQDLKLRIIPFSATVRFLPLGHRSGFVPYVGGGVGVFSWRYSETGRFVDLTDGSIFNANFVGSGSATGPVILGGVRAPVGDWSIGAEIRYQSAKGQLSSDDFLHAPNRTPTIDLGGFNYLFSIGFRF